MASKDSPTFHWNYGEFDDSNFQIRGRTLLLVLVLFLVVLMVAIFYLYGRWVCRNTLLAGGGLVHAPPSRQNAPASIESGRGLDLNTISKLPIILYRGCSSSPNQRETTECCICLGIFQNGEKVKVLPDCRHCYHSECVDKWLRTQSNCPLCRSSLRFESFDV